jgi:anti-sigma factor RsiW
MENLKSFLDGELDLAGKAEVETHLRQDAELAKMSADFSALSGALKGVDPGQPYGREQLESRLAAGSVA